MDKFEGPQGMRSEYRIGLVRKEGPTMNSTMAQDTIAAISTPVAAGGIGMVRVSGPDALKVVDRVFTAVSGKQAEDTPGYRGLFGRVHDGQGEIDEAVVFVYRAPKSYTGEDVAEICCHGGIYLVQRTLRACLNAGARAAQAGEFTRRAFLNGKMNLTQAEAVADLIAAQGQQSAQAALQARDGAIFRRIHQVVEKLLGVSSALAAWVDYPDEDIDEVSDENLRASVYEICGMLEGILKGYDNGRLLREGISTVIVGRPNVGKSTLMNLLAKSEVFAENKLFATLDTTVRKVIIENLPFLLSDTVGFIRKLPTDLVDSFKSTLDEVREADLLVHVVDISHPDFEEQIQVVEKTIADLGAGGKPSMIVFNKVDAYTYVEKAEDDLTPKTKENITLEELMHTWMAKLNDNCIFISAREKTNIDQFRDLLYKKVKELHVQKYPYNDFLYQTYDEE